MSAIAAHYPSSPDRRYPHDLASYADVNQSFFTYSQPSLNAVTASSSSLDTSYALASGTAASAYVWDTPYPTSSSSSLAATTAAFPSSSHPASSGPSTLSNLSAYAQEYASHRPQFTARPSAASYQLSASSPSSSSLASATSRPSYSSASRSYSSLTSATSTTSHTASSSPSRLQNATWNDSSLYTIEPSEPIAAPVPTPSPAATSPPSTPIKSEDPDGEFIIEVTIPSDPAPGAMPEVPLRAIHAAPEMKKMMYAFRLENFAMHDGIKSAATQPGSGGIEVGPLREQPVEIEWQVQLDVPLIAEEEDAFRYGAIPQTPSRAPGAVRKSALYRADTPMSPRESARAVTASYATAASVGSASPALSMEYLPGVDNDGWDTSSAYGGNSSSPASAATSSPSFASVMTPAQSLGWTTGMRGYQAGELGMDSSTYRRAPPSGQSSCASPFSSSPARKYSSRFFFQYHVCRKRTASTFSAEVPKPRTSNHRRILGTTLPDTREMSPAVATRRKCTGRRRRRRRARGTVSLIRFRQPGGILTLRPSSRLLSNFRGSLVPHPRPAVGAGFPCPCVHTLEPSFLGCRGNSGLTTVRRYRPPRKRPPSTITLGSQMAQLRSAPHGP